MLKKHYENYVVKRYSSESSVANVPMVTLSTNASNYSLGLDLARKVKVFCWIMTGKHFHESRARHVKDTWLKRCNGYMFMSSKNDKRFPALDLKISEGRSFLWGKTKKAFKFLRESYLDDYDWFLKADDDTFVIMENLRLMLLPYSAKQPFYFGMHLHAQNTHYMSGGSGYVISQESLRRFVDKGMTNSSICRSDSGGSEDLEFGRCLANVGVLPGDSRDHLGKHRFIAVSTSSILNISITDPSHWIDDYSEFPIATGEHCCSVHVISFHYVNAVQQHFLNYLLYKVRTGSARGSSMYSTMDGALRLAQLIKYSNNNNTRDSLND